MPDSDTSSEVNVKLYDKKGKINETVTENKKSSDTDFYFNLIANQDKTVPEPQHISESSEISTSDSSRKTSTIRKSSSKSSESSSSSRHTSKSRDRYEKMDFGNFSNNASKNKPSTPQPSHSKPTSTFPTTINYSMSPQESRMRKIELLRKLSEIKQKGFSLTKEYDFNSSIEEMEYEYDLLRSFVDKRNGIKIYKNILLNGVSIIEYMNEKYDPFDFHLEGWGEHMQVEIDSYDEVLEELYEKYKGTGKGMPAEIKLVLLLVASGSAYHFTRSQSTIPGLDKALNRNPELISKLINPQKAKSNFMTPQEINIDRQRVLIQQKEKELKQKIKQQQMNKESNLNFMNKPSMPQPTQQMGSRVSEIRVPDNVKDILNRIKTSTSLAGTTDSQDDSASNNDRIVSDMNVSDSKRGRKAKVPSILINTN